MSTKRTHRRKNRRSNRRSYRRTSRRRTITKNRRKRSITKNRRRKTTLKKRRKTSRRRTIRKKTNRKYKQNLETNEGFFGPIMKQNKQLVRDEICHNCTRSLYEHSARRFCKLHNMIWDPKTNKCRNKKNLIGGMEGSSPFYCKLCNAQGNSEKQYKDHINGAPHDQNLREWIYSVAEVETPIASIGNWYKQRYGKPMYKDTYKSLGDYLNSIGIDYSNQRITSVPEKPEKMVVHVAKGSPSGKSSQKASAPTVYDADEQEMVEEGERVVMMQEKINEILRRSDKSYYNQ